MADSQQKGMISAMPSLITITGEEFLEVIKLESDGSFKNYRLMVSKIRNNEGKSAYEIAVENGYVGTSAEWLLTLNGQSIYQLATELGFAGSEVEFLASLKGDAGKSVYQTAVDGGFVGTPADFLKTLVGKSAYQTALDKGYVGTEIQWLGSLKGTKGDPGIQGEDGPIGLDGKSAYDIARVANPALNTIALYLASLKGAEGKSAYEIALSADPSVGTVEEWLASLEGSSAYEHAVAQGFTGNLLEWLESLVGKSAYDLAVAEGFVGTQAVWLASLIGKSAFDLAKVGGFVGTQAQWLVSLKGIDGRTAYESAILGGYGGTEAEFNLSLAEPKGQGGGVFITDIKPQSGAQNVGERVMSADGYSLKECSSTTNAVIVEITAITGNSNYRPVVRLNGVVIPVVAKTDAPLWAGSLAVTLGAADVDGKVILQVEHEDGASCVASVKFDTAPVISAAIFTGNYPGTQTELKAGDVFAARVTSDVDVVAYEIEDFGAFVAKSGTFAAGKIQNIPGLIVADRGNVVTAVGYRIRVQKASGSWSAWVASTASGAVDKVNTVKLNNLFPTITMGVINYPAGQAGLRAGESATVNHTVVAADTYSYASATELTIANAAVYAPAKVVTYKAGTYNSTVQNFTLTATRTANGAVKVGVAIVVIATVKPTVTLTAPAARLRSGGNNGTAVQSHVITLTSDQALASAPTLNAPGGTWDAAPWTSNVAKTIWTRALKVHDDDAKGLFTFNSLNAVGLAGVAQNAVSGAGTYTLGGFVFRTLTVPAYPNREAAIGTQVTLAAKLRCTNLGKGDSGSLNFTYQANMVNAVDKFTITGPTGVQNATGNLWFNLDGANATSNTGGTMKIEIEEVV